MRCFIFTTFLTLSFTLGSAQAANQTPVEQWDTPQLLAGLADADTAIRKKAADRLIEIGMPARAEIIKAARGDNPEQRSQAARILRKLPWATSDDPAEVRDVLEHYGEASDLARSSIVQRLYELRTSSTLLRLGGEEPSDFVRWMIVYVLSASRDAPTQTAIRELKPANDDAPLLFLAARSWLERDRPRALGLFRRAVDADAARPSNDLGLMKIAYENLVSAAMESHDFEGAGELLRRQIPRELMPRRWRGLMRRTGDASLARLLALHEHVGPLRQFGWDCQTWAINTSEKPRLIDGISTRLAWIGFYPSVPMGLTTRLSVLDRYHAGIFLATGELTAAADLELEAAAKLLDGSPEQRRRIARARGGPEPEDIDDMFAELYWRRARAAQNAGDIATADKEVQRLGEFNPSNTDAAIKIILWLKETNRERDAKELFKRIYETGLQSIERSVNKAGARNDLAWLCARCGEKLDEAVTMAQAAVDEMPEVAAFLDTLAEAKYRTGKVEEAIKLETRALELAPGTKFMKEQLERFKSGKP